MSARSLLPAALLLSLSVLLAGCGDSGPTKVEVAPGQIIEVAEPPKAGKGIVSGIVGDDAVYPLADATVFILGLGLNATTDKNGRFAILDVPPGIYIVEGSKKDHAASQTTVDVQPGEVARAVLLLPRVPSTDPYHSTWQHEAYVEAYGAFLSVDGNTTSVRFELDESVARTVVLEAAWEGTIVTPSSSAPFDFRVESHDREIVAGPAPNPFWTQVDARVLPPDRRVFTFSVEPRLDTTLVQATGRFYATVFYNEPAPPQWSILAGNV